MPVHPSCRPALLTLALGLAGLAPSAQALNIVFTNAGSSLNTEQLAAFQTAAAYWENQLSNNVTVYLAVSFGDLGSSTLAEARSELITASYADVRSRLTANAQSPTDTSAISHLQTGPALSFMATQLDGTTRFDNDTTLNNRVLNLTTANAKSLGYTTPTESTSPDARITFANAYASSFAYSRINGQIPGDKIDFITVAQHEIGHALGFMSGVDHIAYCINNAAQCGTTGGFEDEISYTSLDLFRYSAAGVLDMTIGGASYFSVDGGATSIHGFAAGAQASHFGGGSLTLMNPTVAFGQSYEATAADLMALDAIGWNLTAAVPEPQTYALLLCGLGVIAWARRRRGA